MQALSKSKFNHVSSCGNSLNRSSILCALCRIKQRTDSENKLLIRQHKCDIQKYNKLTKILHTYVKFWSILYTNIMCLCFVSLCWQSAFVTCQKRQNVGKFDIKHSILTKKGLNLALFWSKLYKHIILQRIFLQIWRICTDWNEYRGKIYVFFDNLNILVLESAFSVQIFAFIEVFG